MRHSIMVCSNQNILLVIVFVLLVMLGKRMNVYPLPRVYFKYETNFSFTIATNCLLLIVAAHN